MRMEVNLSTSATGESQEPMGLIRTLRLQRLLASGTPGQQGPRGLAPVLSPAPPPYPLRLLSLARSADGLLPTAFDYGGV